MKVNLLSDLRNTKFIEDGHVALNLFFHDFVFDREQFEEFFEDVLGERQHFLELLEIY